MASILLQDTLNKYLHSKTCRLLNINYHAPFQQPQVKSTSAAPTSHIHAAMELLLSIDITKHGIHQLHTGSKVEKLGLCACT